jgi:hypothetical protein
LYRAQVGSARVASREELREMMQSARSECASTKFSLSFLLGEWEEMADAWQLDHWEAYRDIKRLGRKTRLSETQRAALWQVFEVMQRKLADQGKITWARLFTGTVPAQGYWPGAGFRLCSGG